MARGSKDVVTDRLTAEIVGYEAVRLWALKFGQVFAEVGGVSTAAALSARCPRFATLSSNSPSLSHQRKSLIEL